MIKVNIIVPLCAYGSSICSALILLISLCFAVHCKYKFNSIHDPGVSWIPHCVKRVFLAHPPKRNYLHLKLYGHHFGNFMQISIEKAFEQPHE